MKSHLMGIAAIGAILALILLPVSHRAHLNVASSSDVKGSDNVAVSVFQAQDSHFYVLWASGRITDSNGTPIPSNWITTGAIKIQHNDRTGNDLRGKLFTPGSPVKGAPGVAVGTVKSSDGFIYVLFRDGQVYAPGAPVNPAVSTAPGQVVGGWSVTQSTLPANAADNLDISKADFSPQGAAYNSACNPWGSASCATTHTWYLGTPTSGTTPSTFTYAGGPGGSVTEYYPSCASGSTVQSSGPNAFICTSGGGGSSTP